MPFIGNQPALSYTSFAKQDFTTSATTSYTLDQPVANANELALFINFVRQEPTTAYTASGTTLTLTSATSASDDMYCVFLGKAIQTVNPPNGSVGTNQLVDGAVTSGKLASGVLPDNTPAFEAYRTSNQSISNATWTKVQNDIELFDTDNCYDNSTNYRFTPTTAGKYYIFGQIFIPAQSIYIGIAKNGTRIATSRQYASDSDNALMIGQIFDANGSSDYFELECFHQDGASANTEGSERRTHFGAYKIIE